MRIVTVLFFTGLGILTSQSLPYQKKLYLEASHRIAVLKNLNQIIPIKSLDAYKSGYIALSNDSLIQNLQLYQEVHPISYDQFVQSNIPSDIDFFILQLDLEVIDFHQQSILSGSIERLARPYIVLVQSNRAGTLKSGMFPGAQAILCSWDHSCYANQMIAQVIYGAQSCLNRLPFYLNTEYKTGTGLITQSLNRLRYGPPSMGGITSTEFETSLDRALWDAIDNEIFPGANLLVAKDGVVIYRKAIGKVQYELPVPLQVDQLYDLASITKIFSATLGGMWLQSRGQFDVNKTIGYYLPGFKRSNKSSLVWRDVLSHQSGLPATITYYKNVMDKNAKLRAGSIHSKYSTHYPLTVFDQMYAHRQTPAKLLNQIKRLPLLPHRNYVYSDLSMILLGKTIEQITGLALNQFVEQNIFNKLGAYSTSYLPLKAFDKSKIVPTERDSIFRKKLVHGYVHDENAALLGGISGHAGLFSNTNDMAKIAQLLLNNGTYGGVQYFSPQTVESFTSYQYPEKNNRRGLGFDKPLLKYDVNTAHTARDVSSLSYGHSGFTGTFVWIDPAHQLTYILLTNRVYPTRKNNKISQYSIRPCIQQIIYDHILNSSLSQ